MRGGFLAIVVALGWLGLGWVETARGQAPGAEAPGSDPQGGGEPEGPEQPPDSPAPDSDTPQPEVGTGGGSQADGSAPAEPSEADRAAPASPPAAEPSAGSTGTAPAASAVEGAARPGQQPGQPDAPEATGEPDDDGGGDGDEGGSVLDHLHFELGGYFRTRYVYTRNLPIPGEVPARDASTDANYGFMRLRLNPSIIYGEPDKPTVKLHFQIDGLDNVMAGDNARLAAPVFSLKPSNTDVFGDELSDTLFLRRAWIEVDVLLGELRVGRMPSQWGRGILVNDGNGFQDWNDPMFGSTFDRVLFATRPITVANAIRSGNKDKTPLIWAVLYDKIVTDPINNDPGADPGEIDVGPFNNRFAERRAQPFGFFDSSGDDVNEVVTALLWMDEDWNLISPTDKLDVGVYFIYRWQNSTDTTLYIPDVQWNLQVGLGRDKPSFYTEGEVFTVQGSSRGVALAGGRMENDSGNIVYEETNANIWIGTGAIGFRQEDEWAAELEVGYAKGDSKLVLDDNFTMFPGNPDYHVGLVLYQIALAGRSAYGLGAVSGLDALSSRGGIFNSKYIWPQYRYQVLPFLELHGAILAAWADQLDGLVYRNPRGSSEGTSCGFEKECFLGWELDVAARVKWGPHDVMRWDTEVGFFFPGDALRSDNFGLADDFIYSVQSRIGFIF